MKEDVLGSVNALTLAHYQLLNNQMPQDKIIHKEAEISTMVQQSNH